MYMSIPNSLTISFSLRRRCPMFPWLFCHWLPLRSQASQWTFLSLWFFILMAILICDLATFFCSFPGPLNVLCKAYHIVIMSAVAITVMIVMVLMIISRLSILLLIYSALGVKSQYCNGLLALLYKPRRYSLTQ